MAVRETTQQQKVILIYVSYLAVKQTTTESSSVDKIHSISCSILCAGAAVLNKVSKVHFSVARLGHSKIVRVL